MDAVSKAKITDDFQDSLIDMMVDSAFFFLPFGIMVWNVFLVNGFDVVLIKILVQKHISATALKKTG